MIFDNKSLIDDGYESIVEYSIRVPSLTEISDRNIRTSISSIKCGSGEYHIKPISLRFVKSQFDSHCKFFHRLNISIFSKNYSENHLDKINYYLNGSNYSLPPLFEKK